MDNFWSSLRQAFGHLGTIRVMDIVDILLVAAFFYFLITVVRRTKTNKLFQGIVYILLALWLSGEMQLYTVNYILRNAVQVGLLALVVLFQPEIRRFLEKLGTGSIFSRLLGAPSPASEKMSPPAPVPKSNQTWRLGLTWNDGFLSLRYGA